MATPEPAPLEPRGRIAQDRSFVLSELQGFVINDVRVAAADSGDGADMIWFHQRGDALWHSVFGDAGLFFWEEWDEVGAFCNFDDVQIEDVIDVLDLRGATIESVEAQDGTLTVVTAEVHLVMALTDPDTLAYRSVRQPALPVFEVEAGPGLDPA